MSFRHIYKLSTVNSLFLPVGGVGNNLAVSHTACKLAAVVAVVYADILCVFFEYVDFITAGTVEDFAV